VSKLAIVVATFVAGVSCGQPVFAEEAISERCVFGLSTGTHAQNAGRSIFSNSINAFLNERGSAFDAIGAELERRDVER
jgi:hypothetical protein